jgi:pimeloyl-ACP methyl ester carboxylesterase
MSYAIKFPEKLYGLLVADISPFVTEKTEEEAYNHHKSIFEAMLSLDLGKIISRTEAEEELKRKLPDEKIAGFLLKNLQRKETKGFEWRLNIQSLFKNLHMITEGFDREKITEIQTAGFPVTFLKASDSEYIKPEDYPDIIRLFPSAEIKEIPKAGHWLHADQPEIVAGYLKEMAGGF